MRKQLLVVETVPGKPLGFHSLSKMFCILAIAAVVALSPESTGPLAPSTAQAQTTGNCGCTRQWVNPQDYEDDFCGYRLNRDLAFVYYWYCLAQCKIERDYRDNMAFLDWLEEEVADWLDDDELRANIDEAREKEKKKYGDRMYKAYMRLGRYEGEALRRERECREIWED